MTDKRKIRENIVPVQKEMDKNNKKKKAELLNNFVAFSLHQKMFQPYCPSSRRKRQGLGDCRITHPP